MDRVKQGGYSALIEAAYDLIPPGLHGWIRPHFLCGTDPVFAGLHSYRLASYGRSYRDTAHVAYDFHQTGLPRDRRRHTVVLPSNQIYLNPRVVVHELGHVLHAALGFEPDANPVTWYGQTNRFEAFAEAFTAWVMPQGNGYDQARNDLSGSSVVELFERLHVQE